MSTANQLQAVITVDAKNAAFTIEKFVGQTVGGMGQASNAAKGATSAFSGLGGAAVVLNQGLDLARKTIGAVVGVVGDAVTAARGFEKQIGAVDTLLVGSTTNLEGLRAGLLQLDDRLGSSAELTDALYQALSSGVEAGKGVEFVGEAAKLASAGLGDLGGTVDLLTTVLNAYGLEASQSSQVSEILFEAVKKGKTTIEELSGSMGRVIPTAKGAGIQIGDLSAIVAKLTTVGLSTDTAVTSLNAALVAIQSPGADAEKVAKALGFSFDELRTTIREKGLVAGLELLEEKTGGNQQAIAKLIPSVEAQRAVFALLGGDVSKLNGFLADFNKEANAGGQVAAAFEARARTLDGSIEALGVSANKAKIALVDGIKAPLIEITEESRGQIDALRDWLTANHNLMESGFGQWLSGVKVLLEGIAPAARAVAEAMRWWSGSLDSTVGGIGQQIRDVEAEMQRLVDSNQFWWFQSEATTKASDAYKNLETQLAGLRERLNSALEAALRFDGGVTQSGNAVAHAAAQMKSAGQAVAAMDPAVRALFPLLDSLAIATGNVGDRSTVTVPRLGALGDEAEKAAQKAAQAAEKVSQLADASVQFAQSQLQQAAATGDLTRTTEAYNAAVTAAQEAYRTDIAAADAAAAAGKTKAEVDGMRTQAVQKLATATNAAAATQATAYAREEAAQLSLAQAIAQTTIAHDMESLATASASTVGEIYNKTVIDITTELARQREAIEAKRGVTLTATEADLALRQAEEQAGQQIKAAGEAAVKAASQMSDFARQVQAASDQAASAFGDLVTGIVTGQVKFNDAGKIAASIFLRGFQDVLSAQLSDAFKSVFDAAKDVIGTALDGMISTLTGGAAKSLTGMFESALGLAAGTIASSAAVFVPFVGAVGGGLALAFKNKNLGPEASIAIAADMGGAISGAAAVLATGGALAPETLGLSVVVGAVAAGLMAAFGVDRPDMRKRIAYEVQRQLTQALGHDTNYLAALEQGLAPLGVALTPALIQTLAGASRQNDLLRAQAQKLADEYGAEFMAGFSPAFTESVNKHGASSTSVPVSDWIRAFFPDADAATQAYAQELAKSLASVEVASMGLTGSDALVATEQLAAGYVNLAQAQGLSADEFVAMLEAQNQAAGMSTQFLATLDSLNAGLSSQQGELDQVAAAMSRAFGVPVDAGNLTDMFIQVAGATGDAKAAAAIFTTQLQRMAAEDPAIQALVDSLDPPLTEALQNVEDGAIGAAAAFRDLVGTVAADLTNVVDAANLLIGDVSFEGLNDQLASLKEQLASTDDKGLQESLKAQIAAVESQIDALSPKIDVINSQVQDSLNSLLRSAQEDGTLAVDEFTAMLQQLQILATLPAGSVSDSTQALIDSIIAQFQVALKLTDEQVADLRKQIEAGGPIVPPEVVTPPVDQQSLDDAVEGTKGVAQNSEDAAAAQQQLVDAVKDVASAVTGSTDQFTALAQAAGLSSEQVQAAIQPIIGAVGDGKSLTDTAYVLDSITKFLPAEMVPAFKGAFEDASHAVSAVYTDAGNLKSALNSLVGTYEIVVHTTYTSSGSPGGPDSDGDGVPDGADKAPNDPDVFHRGGVIPGPPGTERIIKGLAGELVVPVDATSRLLRGAALDGLTAHDVAPFAAPVTTASASGPSVEAVAAAVEGRLTQGGRMQILQIPSVDAPRLAKALLIENADEAFRSGALTGAKVKRNVARPT